MRLQSGAPDGTSRSRACSAWPRFSRSATGPYGDLKAGRLKEPVKNHRTLKPNGPDTDHHLSWAHASASSGRPRQPFFGKGRNGTRRALMTGGAAGFGAGIATGRARRRVSVGGSLKKSVALPKRALQPGQRTASSSARPVGGSKVVPQGRHFQRTCGCCGDGALSPSAAPLRRRIGRRGGSVIMVRRSVRGARACCPSNGRHTRKIYLVAGPSPLPRLSSSRSVSSAQARHRAPCR